MPNIRPGFSSAWMFPQSQDEYDWARAHGSAVYHYLPQVAWTGFGGTVVPAETLNQTATLPSEQQAQVAAIDAVLPVTFGRDRLGARLADLGVLNGNLVQFCVWGRGPYDAQESFTIDNAAPPAGVIATHYTGTQTTPDPTLAALYGGGYADVLPGIAYTVLQVPPGLTGGFPQAAAVWRGRIVYDPRLSGGAGGWAWSDNWALLLADFLSSTLYGKGREMDWASVAVVANACDEVVGGKPRRSGGGITLAKRLEVDAWVETLRSYAGCWVLDAGGPVRLVADRPAASVKHFDFAAGNLKSIAPIELADLSQIPTIVEIVWTDTSKLPWIEAAATVYADGVEAGTTPIRFSRVPMPGIHDASQAQREAVERLNKLALSDIATEIEVFDAGRVIEPGDIIQVSAPLGLAAKEFRVKAASGSLGRYKLRIAEYAEAAYSDAVVAYNPPPDTNLPNPAQPPAVTGLTLAEEVYQLENGTYASRLKATWDAVTFAYLRAYRFEVWQAGQPIHTADAAATVAYSPAVAQGVIYTVKVAVATSLAVGAFASDSITAQGKLLVPGDVPVNSFTGFEVGGTCYFGWRAAVDIDIWRYQLRYGAVGGSFATATILDEVDALRYQTKMIPVGTWVVYIVAMDSVKQLSANPRSVTLTVTLDASAFLVDVYDQTNPTLTNMIEYALGRTDGVRRFVTTSGQSWNAMFPAAMDTYTSPLLSYHAAVDSSWRGESEDFGQELSGDWQGQANVQALSGSIESEVQTSPDASVWTPAGSLSAKATARFARLEHRSSGTATLYAEIPQQQISLNVVTRRETGAVSVAATGITTISLAGTYTAVKSIQVTPRGTAFGAATVDNVIVGTYLSDTDFTDDDDYFSEACSFDAYLFDAAGARIAGVCDFTFDGV